MESVTIAKEKIDIKNTTDNNTRIRNYYPGLDWIRIFLSISIVAWHSKLLGPSNYFFESTSPRLRDIMYGNVFLVSVPLFFLISFFLYINNPSRKPIKRILELLNIYILWNIFAIIIFNSQSSIKSWEDLTYLLRGGYGPLWFIYTLLILTIFLELTLRLKKTLKKSYTPMLLGMTFFTGIFTLIRPVIFLKYSINAIKMVSYLRAFEFIFWIFLALLISDLLKNNKELIKKKITTINIFFISTSFLFTFLEFKYLPIIYSNFTKPIMPIYERPSVILISIFIFINAVLVTKAQNKLISLLSSLTMGVFCIHFFLLEILVVKYPMYFIYFENHRSLLFIFIITSSFIGALFLKKTRWI